VLVGALMRITMIPRHPFRSAMLMCFVALLGCSKPVDRLEVPGPYKAVHKNGAETLELRPDGTYIHRVRAADGSASTQSNRWRFEPFEGEPKVALDDFTPHFPESQKADVLLDVEKDWGRVRLYLSYDLDQYYLKDDVK
jgi:hypothetical protein